MSPRSLGPQSPRPAETRPRAFFRDVLRSPREWSGSAFTLNSGGVAERLAHLTALTSCVTGLSLLLLAAAHPAMGFVCACVGGSALVAGLAALWLQRRGRESASVATASAALIAATVWLSFEDEGAHVLLLPWVVVLQLSLCATWARIGGAAVAAGLFVGFEAAALGIGVRLALRVGLAVSLLVGTHVLLADRGEQLALSRDRIKESAQARMTFLTMMSHEIRTPLNAVIAFSDMLCAALKDDKEHADMAETVRSSSQALLAIINDVLDFSRVDSGQLTLSPALVELDDVVDGTLAALHGIASAKGLTLCSDVQLPLPCRVEVDAVRLRQVLTNLVGNALKFTERGHVLLTVTAANKGEVEFSIFDTGCGIPREALATIFEPYQQADQRLVRAHDGTGLGLAICSRVATAMGGSLAVESEVGRGSTFRLRVPLAIATPPPSPSPSPPSSGRIDVEVSSPVLQSTLRSAVARLSMPLGSASVLVTDVDDPQRAGDRRVILVGDPLHHVESPRQQQVKRLPLPVRRAALRDALTPPAEAVEQPKLDLGRDVLVAEDNAVNRKVIAHMLKRLGCTFRLAVDGADCVEQFKERRPDVVLMDCHMPVMDGFEATRAIRAIDKDIPIFAITADALEATNTEALASGMNRVLTKPVLVGALREALSV